MSQLCNDVACPKGLARLERVALDFSDFNFAIFVQFLSFIKCSWANLISLTYLNYVCVTRRIRIRTLFRRSTALSEHATLSIKFSKSSVNTNISSNLSQSTEYLTV